MKKNNKKQLGQSMIEAVVAVGIVVIILVALVAAVTLAVRNATFSKNKSLANKYVNEGIEAVRSIRDRSWQTLLDASGSDRGLEYSSGQWSFTDLSVTPAPGFTRVVSLETVSDNEVKVTVTVEWQQGSKNFKSEATTTFTKWK